MNKKIFKITIVLLASFLMNCSNHEKDTADLWWQNLNFGEDSIYMSQIQDDSSTFAFSYLLCGASPEDVEGCTVKIYQDGVYKNIFRADKYYNEDSELVAVKAKGLESGASLSFLITRNTASETAYMGTISDQEDTYAFALRLPPDDGNGGETGDDPEDLSGTVIVKGTMNGQKFESAEETLSTSVTVLDENYNDQTEPHELLSVSVDNLAYSNSSEEDIPSFQLRIKLDQKDLDITDLELNTTYSVLSSGSYVYFKENKSSTLVKYQATSGEVRFISYGLPESDAEIKLYFSLVFEDGSEMAGTISDVVSFEEMVGMN